jgi:hypothetical protein
MEARTNKEARGSRHSLHRRNLYHGLRARFQHGYLWLDLAEVVRRLRPRDNIVAVRYFTTLVRNDPPAEARQQAYLAALETHSSPLLNIVHGRYQAKYQECRGCGATWTSYEEKETDVNIAVSLVADAASSAADLALLIISVPRSVPREPSRPPWAAGSESLPSFRPGGSAMNSKRSSQGRSPSLTQTSETRCYLKWSLIRTLGKNTGVRRNGTDSDPRRPTVDRRQAASQAPSTPTIVAPSGRSTLSTLRRNRSEGKRGHLQLTPVYNWSRAYRRTARLCPRALLSPHPAPRTSDGVPAAESAHDVRTQGRPRPPHW